MDESQIAGKAGLSQLLSQIEAQYGLLVLMLVTIIVFGFFLFWKLIWKVWSGAASARESEIARLASERDTYRALVFKDLRTSKASDMNDDRSAEIKRKDRGDY